MPADVSATSRSPRVRRLHHLTVQLPPPAGIESSVQIGAGDAMPYIPRSPCSRSTSSRDSRFSRPSVRATRLIFAKCSMVSIR